MSLKNCFSRYEEHIILMAIQFFLFSSTLINDGNSKLREHVSEFCKRPAYIKSDCTPCSRVHTKCFKSVHRSFKNMSFSFELKSLCISYLTNLIFMSSFRLQYPGNYILCIEIVILLPKCYWFLNNLSTDIIFLNIYITLFESIVKIFLRFIQQVLI